MQPSIISQSTVSVVSRIAGLSLGFKQGDSPKPHTTACWLFSLLFQKTNPGDTRQNFTSALAVDKSQQQRRLCTLCLKGSLRLVSKDLRERVPKKLNLSPGLAIVFFNKANVKLSTFKHFCKRCEQKILKIQCSRRCARSHHRISQLFCC